MENNDYKYLLEMIQSAHERTVKRLIIALVVCIALMFSSFALSVYAWLQYDYTGTETKTITVDGQSGTANYIGSYGSIVNGEGNGNGEKDTHQAQENK